MNMIFKSNKHISQELAHPANIPPFKKKPSFPLLSIKCNICNIHVLWKIRLHSFLGCKHMQWEKKIWMLISTCTMKNVHSITPPSIFSQEYVSSLATCRLLVSNFSHLRNIIVPSFTFFLLQFDRNTTNRTLLNALHEMGNKSVP